MQKKDRSVNKPPAGFEVFLEMFNLTRIKLVFNNCRGAGERYRGRITRPNSFPTFWGNPALWDRLHDAIHASTEEQKQNLIRFLENEIPLVIKENSKYCQYLFGVNSLEKLSHYDVSDLYTAGTKFINFCNDLQVFEILIEQINALRKFSDFEQKIKQFLTAMPTEVIIAVDSQGFLDAEVKSFTRFNKIDPKRLKKCLWCGNIFWAFRLNMKYCSDICSNAHHQKLFRADEKKRKDYNEKRKAARQSKKELEEGQQRKIQRESKNNVTF